MKPLTSPRVWGIRLVGLVALTVWATVGHAAERPWRPARPELPDGVRVVRDLAYVPDGHQRQRLDLYLPEKPSEKPLPVVVWVHGGAWRAGNKNLCKAVWLVPQGYAVASINYRLNYQGVFPAQIQDCKAAIRWLRANAKQYGLDPDHVGAWGASAGGHLVSLLGTTAGVKEFEGTGGNLDQSSRVQAVVDWFGPSDLVGLGAHERKAEEPLAKLLGVLVSENPEPARRASPLTHVDKNAAPFLIMQGDADRIVPPDQSRRLAEAIKKAGVEARLEMLSGAGHGGAAFDTLENRKLIQAFFDEHLKGKKTEKTKDGTAE